MQEPENIPTTGSEPDPSAPDVKENPVTETVVSSTRISVNMNTLVAELMSLKPFVATKTSITILRGVRLTMATSQVLTLRATNMAQWALMQLPATALNDSHTPVDFDVVVDFTALVRMLKAMDKGTTVILDCQVNGDKRELIIGNQSGGVVVPSLPPSDFPQTDNVLAVAKDCTTLEVDPAFITRLVQVREFTSDDETRRTLNAVQVLLKDKAHATLTATDSYRMAIVADVSIEKATTGADKGFALLSKAGMLLHRDFIAAIAHAALKRKVKSNTLTFSFLLPTAEHRGAGELVVLDGNRRYGTRLVDGRFPSWEQLIPADDNFTDTIALDGDVLHETMHSVQAARGRVKGNIYAPVVLTALGAPEASLVASFKSGDVDFSRPFALEDEYLFAAEIPVDSLAVGLNPEFLDSFVTTFGMKGVALDIIRASHPTDETHDLPWATTLRPLLVTSPEDPHMTGVLMPIRLND